MTAPQQDYVFKPFKVMRVKFRSRDCPRPRSGHRIACDDVNIYCYGGYNPSLPTNLPRRNPTWTPARPLFKELWSFSLATRKWKHHKIFDNMPDELASTAMCMIGSILTIFGGTGAPFGNSCSNDLIMWRTCPGDARMRVMDVTGTKPPAQYGQTILCHDMHLYTMGGTNGTEYNLDIHRLDLHTMNWEEVYMGTQQQGEPTGRYRHEIAKVHNKVYVFGGGTADSAFNLMEIPEFDLVTNTWRILAGQADDSGEETIFPLPRKCHSAVLVDTPHGPQVFVAAGYNEDTVFTDIWRLNLSDLQWTLMTKSVFPRPVYFHSSIVTSSGCMYLFGGIEPGDDSLIRNNAMYKVWLCIPKLSEICWEALLRFHPKLDQVDSRSLRNIGIPLHFIERLK